MNKYRQESHNEMINKKVETVELSVSLIHFYIRLVLLYLITRCKVFEINHPKLEHIVQ